MNNGRSNVPARASNWQVGWKAWIPILLVLTILVTAVPGCRRVRGVAKALNPIRRVRLALGGGDKQTMDAQTSAPEEMPDSVPARTLKQADDAFRARNWNRALSLYEQAEAQAAQDHEQFLSVRVQALAQIARCHLKLDDKETGRQYLALAATFADPDADPLGWSRYLGVRGRFEWQDQALGSAQFTFEQMYDYCMSHNLHERAVDAAHMVAIVAESPQERIDWSLKGIRAAEEGGMTSWLGPLWNNLGWTYDDLGRHQNALEALENARRYHYESDNEIAKLVADYSIGVQHRKLGNLAEAREWLEPALEWAERLYFDEAVLEHAEWVGHTHREMGELELAEGNRDAAKAHFQTAVEKLREAKMPEWDADGFNEIEQNLQSLS